MLGRPRRPIVQHAGRPAEAAGDREQAAHRAGQVDRHRDGGWRIDPQVRRRRGVVVGVAEVAAVHDAADPVRDNPVGRLEPKRAVVADRDAQQAVRHRSPVTLHPDRVLRLASILHCPCGGPAERRRRDRCGERAPRSRHDPDPPRVVRGRAHRGGHLRTQPVHVQPRGVGIRVDLERHRAAIDPVAVPCVVEHLSTVEATEQVVDLVPPQRLVEQDRLLAAELLGGKAASVGQLERDRLPLLGHQQLGLDEPGPRRRRGVDDRHGTAGHPAGNRTGRAAGECRADLLRLGEPDEDLADDRIDAAAADGVVCAVLDHLSPRQGKEGSGPALRRQVERAQGLRVALQERLRASGGLLDVDPRAGHAHQDVGACTGAHLAAPARIIRRQPWRLRHVLRQRADPHVRRLVHLVQAADQCGELGDRRGVVGAVHGEHGIVAEPGPRPVDEAVRRGREPIRHGEHAGGVAVARRHVLRSHP